MTILTAPSALELSGNLTKFLISNTTGFTFKLSKGATVLLEQVYNPGESGLVEIDVRDIVEASLSYLLQDSSSSYTQTNIAATFTALIGSTTVNFKVVRAGVENLSDTATNFLTANWLTWQPQVKKVSYYSPEFMTFYAVVASVVKCKAYFADNTTETITLDSKSSGSAYTIPTQYALINAALVKKLPSYYDVWVENATGTRLSYIQRFVASNKLSEDEQWFIFENSLGGADTLRAYGKTAFTGDHTHNIAEIDEVSEEYRIDTRRQYQKNTGHLDSLERRWLLDFFPSKKKFIYSDSAIRSIVMVESDVNYESKELPSNYNFTYQYASSKPYLNLSRSTTLPAEVTLIVPDIGSFTLPPRLNEFPHISLTEGALIPVQNPYSEQVGVVSVETLAEYIRLQAGDGTSIEIPTNEQGQAIGLDKEVVDGTVILSLKLEDITPETLEEGHQPILVNSIGELYCMGVGVEANGAIHKAVGSDGSIVLSLKTEMESVETVEAGHIKIQMNDGGELFGEMKWVEIYEGIQL